MADATDLKSVELRFMRVRVPPSAFFDPGVVSQAVSGQEMDIAALPGEGIEKEYL